MQQNIKQRRPKVGSSVRPRVGRNGNGSGAKPTTSLSRKLRKDRLIQEHIHDPYRSKKKPSEPSVCPVCNAVFRAGRWQWADSWPADAHRELCQACQRVRDGYPAGLVTLHGGFVVTHKDEIINLARNHEQGEKNERPLHRIMKIEHGRTSITIQTTDIHLPRRIGEALRRAFKGELTLRYEDDGCFVRVNWNRET